MAEKGSIYSVPALGPTAACLLLTSARGLTRDRPEHLVVPLYSRAEIVGDVGVDDFRLFAPEVIPGAEWYAAIWNIRPLLAADLGSEVGRVVSNEALDDLRDAYLRKADPSIKVAPERVGLTPYDSRSEEWHDKEITDWQRLSARVFDDSVPADSSGGSPYVIVATRAYFSRHAPSFGVATTGPGAWVSGTQNNQAWTRVIVDDRFSVAA
jgi:hypothetical protein